MEQNLKRQFTLTLDLEGLQSLKSRISVIIGGKCQGCPSLYTRTSRPMGSRKLEWKTNLHGFLHGMKWTTLHDLHDFASSPPQRGRTHTKLGDDDTSKCHNPQRIKDYCVERPT